MERKRPSSDLDHGTLDSPSEPRRRWACLFLKRFTKAAWAYDECAVESHVEEAALSWFEAWATSFSTAPTSHLASRARNERAYQDVVLVGRLRDAIERLNPAIPAEAREEAFRKVLRPDSPSLVGNNRAFHRMLRDGVEVEYRRADGIDRGRPGAAGRLRRPGQQRLAGRQPVHRDRGPAQPPARHRGVRQRPAAGGDRTEERGRRGRHDLDRLQPAADLQAADPVAVRLQRGAGRLGRPCRPGSAR